MAGMLQRCSFQSVNKCSRLLRTFSLPLNGQSRLHGNIAKSDKMPWSQRREPRKSSDTSVMCIGFHPDKTTRQDLKNLFPHAKGTYIDRHKRIAYVDLHTAEEVDDLVNGKASVTIHGDKLRFRNKGKVKEASNSISCQGFEPTTTYYELCKAFPTAIWMYIADNKSHAYVSFKTKEEVEDLINGEKRVSIRGDKLRLWYTGDALRARTDDNKELLCQGFATTTTVYDLCKVFPTANSILMADDKSHAYIVVNTAEEVENLINGKNKVSICGDKLHLWYAGVKARARTDRLLCQGFEPATTTYELCKVFPTATSILFSDDKSHAFVYFKTKDEVENLINGEKKVSAQGDKLHLWYLGVEAEARYSDGKNLNCQGFAPTTTVYDLCKVFPTAVTIHVARDKSTAYIRFQTVEEVENVINGEDTVSIGGDMLRLWYYGDAANALRDDRTVLLCQGFEPTTSRYALCKAFPTAVVINVAKTKSRCVAYVHFKTPEDVHNMISKKDSLSIGRNKLRMSYLGSETKGY